MLSSERSLSSYQRQTLLIALIHCQVSGGQATQYLHALSGKQKNSRGLKIKVQEKWSMTTQLLWQKYSQIPNAESRNKNNCKYRHTGNPGASQCLYKYSEHLNQSFPHSSERPLWKSHSATKFFKINRNDIYHLGIPRHQNHHKAWRNYQIPLQTLE